MTGGVAPAPVLVAALLRMRLRRALRRAADEAFILAVLAPIVVVPAWWMGARYLDLARARAQDLVTARPLALAAALVALLALAAWPGARREAAGDALLAPQPVPHRVRWAASTLATAGRALLPAVLAFAVVLGLADAGRLGPLRVDGASVLSVGVGLAAVSVVVSCLVLVLAAALPTRSTARAASRGPAAPAALDGPVLALLRRDLRLVARGAPAVAIAGLVAALCLAAAVATLLDPRLVDAASADLLRRRLVVGFVALGCLAASAVAPFLAAHQLPRLWLERSAGVPLEAPARAKALLALALAAVPAVVGLGLMAALPVAVSLRAAAAGQLLLAWIFVGSTLGLAVYEVPEAPLLGLLFAGIVSAALAGLVLFVPQVWWLWTIGWTWIVGQFAERSVRRLLFLEVRR